MGHLADIRGAWTGGCGSYGPGPKVGDRNLASITSEPDGADVTRLEVHDLMTGKFVESLPIAELAR